MALYSCLDSWNAKSSPSNEPPPFQKQVEGILNLRKYNYGKKDERCYETSHYNVPK